MMQTYNAKIVSSLFWIQETRLTAEYMMKGYSKKELCEISKEENIYNAPSIDRRRKIAGTTYNRLSKLPKELIYEMSICDIEEARLINLLAIMLYDDLFNDFMVEIFKQKMLVQAKTLTSNDVRLYLENKEQNYESVQKMSDVTKKKMYSTYIKIINEAGLINNTKEGLLIKPYIDPSLEELLKKHQLQDFITIITGESR